LDFAAARKYRHAGGLGFDKFAQRPIAITSCSLAPSANVLTAYITVSTPLRETN